MVMSAHFDIAKSDTSDLLTFNAIQRQDDIKVAGREMKRNTIVGLPI